MAEAVVVQALWLEQEVDALAQRGSVLRSLSSTSSASSSSSRSSSAHGAGNSHQEPETSTTAQQHQQRQEQQRQEADSSLPGSSGRLVTSFRDRDAGSPRLRAPRRGPSWAAHPNAHGPQSLKALLPPATSALSRPLLTSPPGSSQHDAPLRDAHLQSGSSCLSRPGPWGRFESKLFRLLKWLGRAAARAAGALDSSLPIIHPKHPHKAAWDVFIMVFIIYYAITVPLEISYGMPQGGYAVQSLDWSINLLFFYDMCINFRTAYFNGHGKLVKESRLIAKHYLQFWFWVDLLATIPYDLFAMAAGVSNGGGTATIVLQVLRTPRLLRLGRLVRMLDHVKNIQSFKVVLLLCIMVMASHWLACIWYCLYKYSSFTSGPTDWSFDAYHDGMVISYYLSAFYQCFLLILGNDQTPLNNAERVFFIITGILGSFFYATVLGQMAVLVASMGIVGTRHRQRHDITMQAIRYGGAPKAPMARAEAYFEYIAQYSHPTSEGMMFLNDLPPGVYAEIAGDVYEPLLRRVPVFQGLEDVCLTRLALKMRLTVTLAGEVLCRYDEPVNEVWVIRRGNVALLQSCGQLAALLGPGDSWGAVEVLCKVRSTNQLVALKACDLLTLGAADIRHVLRTFPVSTVILEDNALSALWSEQDRYGIWMDDQDGSHDASSPFCLHGGPGQPMSSTTLAEGAAVMQAEVAEGSWPWQGEVSGNGLSNLHQGFPDCQNGAGEVTTTAKAPAAGQVQPSGGASPTPHSARKEAAMGAGEAVPGAFSGDAGGRGSGGGALDGLQQLGGASPAASPRHPHGAAAPASGASVNPSPGHTSVDDSARSMPSRRGCSLRRQDLSREDSIDRSLASLGSGQGRQSRAPALPSLASLGSGARSGSWKGVDALLHALSTSMASRTASHTAANVGPTGQPLGEGVEPQPSSLAETTSGGATGTFVTQHGLPLQAVKGGAGRPLGKGEELQLQAVESGEEEAGARLEQQRQLSMQRSVRWHQGQQPSSNQTPQVPLQQQQVVYAMRHDQQQQQQQQVAHSISQHQHQHQQSARALSQGQQQQQQQQQQVAHSISQHQHQQHQQYQQQQQQQQHQHQQVSKWHSLRGDAALRRSQGGEPGPGTVNGQADRVDIMPFARGRGVSVAGSMEIASTHAGPEEGRGGGGAAAGRLGTHAFGSGVSRAAAALRAVRRSTSEAATAEGAATTAADAALERAAQPFSAMLHRARRVAVQVSEPGTRPAPPLGSAPSSPAVAHSAAQLIRLGAAQSAAGRWVNLTSQTSRTMHVRLGNSRKSTDARARQAVELLHHHHHHHHHHPQGHTARTSEAGAAAVAAAAAATTQESVRERELAWENEQLRRQVQEQDAKLRACKAAGRATQQQLRALLSMIEAMSMKVTHLEEELAAASEQMCNLEAALDPHSLLSRPRSDAPAAVLPDYVVARSKILARERGMVGMHAAPALAGGAAAMGHGAAPGGASSDIEAALMMAAQALQDGISNGISAEDSQTTGGGGRQPSAMSRRASDLDGLSFSGLGSRRASDLPLRLGPHAHLQLPRSKRQSSSDTLPFVPPRSQASSTAASAAASRRPSDGFSLPSRRPSQALHQRLPASMLPLISRRSSSDLPLGLASLQQLRRPSGVEAAAQAALLPCSRRASLISTSYTSFVAPAGVIAAGRAGLLRQLQGTQGDAAAGGAAAGQGGAGPGHLQGRAVLTRRQTESALLAMLKRSQAQQSDGAV